MARVLAPLLLAMMVAGCAAAEPAPARECSTTFWAKATLGTPRVVGSFGGWRSPGIPMAPYGEDDWHFLTITLPPGEHGYLVDGDDGIRPDPFNPQRTFHDGWEVSLAFVPDCSAPAVTIESVAATDDGTVTVSGTFLRAGEAGDVPEGGPQLASVRATDAAGRALEAVETSPETGTFVLRGSGFPRGRATFRIEAKDAAGALAEAPAAVAWVKPAAPRWEEGLIYQVVVDRFRGDGGAPLDAPETPGRRAGGTLDGVRAAIEEGYFEGLGATTLWLSPVYTNPTGLFEGRDGQMYEGYHGYWALASREVDPAIGGEEALRAVITAAHARGLAVLLDFVPNHVHEDNPRYVEQSPKGWFNDGPEACICGAPGCGWGERIQDCWFAPYLPDVRWQADGPMRETLGDLRFWMDTFEADGVRIDAVPMMPRLATRRLALALREGYAPSDALFSIGEVFTGPGPEGLDAIKYFLGPDGLDSAFDFPLTWAVRSVIAHENGGFFDIEEALAYSDGALAGSSSVLGRMVGNHDMSRFISEATGHGGAIAWSSPAPQPLEGPAFDKLRVALGLVMTLPGVPVIFQGDEVGLAGGSDPDNRRVLPDEAALSASQQALLDATRALGRVRTCSAALRKGSRETFRVTERTYGFARVAPEEAALVMISTETEPAQIVPPLSAVPQGVYTDALTLESFEVGGGSPVSVAPYSVRILLPEKSPCLSAEKPSP
jgi:glycosidase